MASSVIVLSGDVARFLAGLLAAGTRCRGPGFPRRVVRGEGMVHGEPAMTFIRTAAGVLVGLLATASPVLGQSTRVDVQGGTLSIETIETGLVNPWGLAFLPDGRMLVTERPGRLRVIALDGSMSKALEGLPEIFAQGQGGLLDVAASPDFAETGWVYVSYAEPGEGGASTAVARGRLGDGRLRSEEHTSELQSLMRNSYAVFCLNKKKEKNSK